MLAVLASAPARKTGAKMRAASWSLDVTNADLYSYGDNSGIQDYDDNNFHDIGKILDNCLTQVRESYNEQLDDRHSELDDFS
eukprot:2053833-Amphidinium_carterae.1